MNSTPFFSIVVPCYNSGAHIYELLESIALQGMNDEIEVILSDDHSTEPYDDIVEVFKDDLTIKRIQTDYNCCPGNTRQKGVEQATGEWITFIDHDDIFIEGILKKVKDKIKESGEEYYVIGKFIEADPKTYKILHRFDNPTGWTHGKFFNRKNLWDAFDMHYKKDLYSHEDTYICSLADCIMHSLGHEPLRIDDIIIVWRAWSDSVSRSKYIKLGHEHPFIEVLLPDYVQASAYVYFNAYKSGLTDAQYTKESLIQILGILYFYMMSFIFYQPETYLKENWQICRDVKHLLSDNFGTTNVDIWRYMASNNGMMFYEIMQSATPGDEYFYIPCMTLDQFLDYLDSGANGEDLVKGY